MVPALAFVVVSVFSNWNCNAAIGQRYLTLCLSPNGERGQGMENLTLGPSPTGEGGREDGSEDGKTSPSAPLQPEREDVEMEANKMLIIKGVLRNSFSLPIGQAGFGEACPTFHSGGGWDEVFQLFLPLWILKKYCCIGP